MDFYEVIRSRRAVRNYKPDMIAEDIIYKVIDAANWAPSGLNTQSWEFIVVGGDKLKAMGENLAELLQPVAAKIADEGKRTAYIDSLRSYYGAPLIIVALAPVGKNDTLRKMHLEGVSAAFQNLLLAACAEGLGTCWMTSPLGGDAFLRELLGIADDKEIVAVSPIGYPAVVPKAPARLDPDLKDKVIWVK